MRFDFITIFPTIFDSYFSQTILFRAQKKGLIKIQTHDLRKFAAKNDSHKSVDGRPFGGGPGMVLMVAPFYKILKKLKLLSPAGDKINRKKARVIMLTPAGKEFTQRDAERLTRFERVVFLCGRYEGFDARIEKFVDEKVSIGKYVLAGGELPAMVVTEAIARNIPGVVGHADALKEETFSSDLGYKEYPHYTRPEVFYPKGASSKGQVASKQKGWRVPKVLLSGNHQKICEWRKVQM